MNFQFPHPAKDPRTILARVKQAEGRLRTHELVERIREKERRNREAARELVERSLPSYEDLPMGARS